MTNQEIFLALMKALGVSKTDAQGRSRKKEISFARHIVSYHLHTVLDWPKLTIARASGYHHSSIIHGISKIDDVLRGWEPETVAEKLEILSSLDLEGIKPKPTLYELLETTIKQNERILNEIRELRNIDHQPGRAGIYGIQSKT